MNIHDVKVELPEESAQEFWIDFVLRRKERFYAFCKVENLNEGLVQPNISLSSAKGQEAFRILAFRIIEEAAESLQANEPEHKLEEMTDAINYVLSVPYLDLTVIPDVSLLDVCIELSKNKNSFIESHLDYYDLGTIAYQLGVETGDTAGAYFSDGNTIQGLITYIGVEIAMEEKYGAKHE